MYARPGGRVGAIALAATGVAAAYMDVIAVTTIYHWVPAPVGLVVAAVIGGGGLTLARRWDSQHLGLLVLVPLIVLAPVGHRRHHAAARRVHAGAVGGLAAGAARQGLDLAACGSHRGHHVSRCWSRWPAVYFDARRDLWLAGACGIAAVLAIAGALILLPPHRKIGLRWRC